MNIVRLLQFIAPPCLILLCSCATQKPVVRQLPPETFFNETASRGGPLLLTLAMEDGEKLLFMVDTGSADTFLNQSLEPKLGKRLGSTTTRWAFYEKRTDGIYPAPKLYLGHTQLLLGNRIKTDAASADYDGGRIMGVLGMDCLRHYCVQMDFAKSKMRFLNPNDLKNGDLGKAYPLDFFFGACFTYADILDMQKVFFRIDTGLFGGVDFMLKPNAFRWEMREEKPFGQSGTNFILFPNGVSGTNRVTFADRPAPAALLSRIEFGSEAYTNLVILEDMSKFWPHENFIGLRFFARNVVTFDFPNKIMYLKPEGVGHSSQGD
jgi:hypothetical protein